jgi:hypothetical protein
MDMNRHTQIVVEFRKALSSDGISIRYIYGKNTSRLESLEKGMEQPPYIRDMLYAM